MLGAKIDTGLKIAHYNGIVICAEVVIGKNLHIRQNTTIGIKTQENINTILIGDNVDIGANSCIIGDNLKIGDNVIIGAMSFVNNDIPSNCTYITKKNNNIIMH